MKIQDAWLPEFWRGKNPDVKAIKWFGISLTIDLCRIEWRTQCGISHWIVWYVKDDDSIPLEEFNRLDDAIRFVLDQEAVLKAVEFEREPVHDHD